MGNGVRALAIGGAAVGLFFRACGGSEPPPVPPPSASASAPPPVTATASASASASAEVVALPPDPDWRGLAKIPNDFRLDGKQNEWGGGAKKGWFFAERERVVVAAKLPAPGASWTLRLRLGEAFDPQPRVFANGSVVAPDCASLGAAKAACEDAIKKQREALKSLVDATVREYVITAGGVTVGGAPAPAVKVALTADLLELEIPASELPALSQTPLREAALSVSSGAATALERVALPEGAFVGGAFGPVAHAALEELQKADEAPHPIAATFDPKGKDAKLRVLVLAPPAQPKGASQAATLKEVPLTKPKVEASNQSLEVVRYDVLGAMVLAGRVKGTVEGAFGVSADKKPKVLRTAKRGTSIDVAWEAGRELPGPPKVYQGFFQVSRFFPDGNVHPDQVAFEQVFVGTPTRTVSADLGTLTLSGKLPGESGTPVKAKWVYDKASDQYVEKP